MRATRCLSSAGKCLVITERAVLPGKEKVVMDALLKLQAAARAAPGFVSSVAYTDTVNAYKLVVVSRWTDQKHWRAWAGVLERSEAIEAMRPFLYDSIVHRVLIEEGSANQDPLL